MSQRAMHHSPFEYLKFFKTGAQIKEASGKVKAALEVKVKERHERIQVVVKQKGLTESQLLLAMQEVGHHYAMSSTVGAPSSGGSGNEDVLVKSILTAGEKQQIQQELLYIRNEETEAEKMRVIVDNLSPDASFELSFSDLEYLGF